MEYNIAVVRGDGIGPEVISEAIKVLNAVGEKYGHTFHYEYVLAGGEAIDETGRCLPDETVSVCSSISPLNIILLPLLTTIVFSSGIFPSAANTADRLSAGAS